MATHIFMTCWYCDGFIEVKRHEIDLCGLPPQSLDIVRRPYTSHMGREIAVGPGDTTPEPDRLHFEGQ